jgi:hypothetical protein
MDVKPPERATPPRSPWKPAQWNLFQWRTGEVFGTSDVTVGLLGIVVSLDGDRRGRSGRVAPVLVRSSPAADQGISRYRAEFYTGQPFTGVSFVVYRGCGADPKRPVAYPRQPIPSGIGAALFKRWVAVRTMLFPVNRQGLQPQTTVVLGVERALGR